MRSRVYVVFSLLLFACKDQEYPQAFPIVLTSEVTGVTSEGADLAGSLESLGTNQKIIQYGFVWSESDKPTLSSSHTSFVDNIQKGRFSKRIKNDLLKGKTYYVKAFVQTDQLIVYGDVRTFESKGGLPPVVKDFTPKKGFEGTEVTITGANFSSSTKGNHVMIGGLPVEVISANDSILKIKSPVTPLIGDYPISITVAERQVTTTSLYSLLGARITSISKLTGRVGDLITIKGEYFAEPITVSFGPPIQWGVNFTSAFIISDTEIECYVPDAPNTNENVQLYSYPSSGQKYFIFPEKFNIQNSWNKIVDQVPLQNYLGYTSTVVGGSVFVTGGTDLYEFKVSTKVWSKKANFPGQYRLFGTAFSLNGKVYYGFGEGYHAGINGANNGANGLYYNDLWLYDPTMDSWSFVGNAPMAERSRMVSFVVNGKSYMGFGWGQVQFSGKTYNDFWEYDPNLNSWNEITTPIRSTYTTNAVGFAVGNKGYLVRLESSVWEFDPGLNKWTKKSDFPIYNDGGLLRSADAGLLVGSGNGYGSRYVMEYNPGKDRWINRQTLQYGLTEVVQFSHFINNKLYVSGGSVWEMSFE